MYCVSIKFFLAPSAPRNLTATVINETSIQLQWTEPQILNGIILRYRVSCCVLCCIMNNMKCST